MFFRKSYRSRVTPRKIRAHLDRRFRNIGVYVFDSIDSTNLEARRRLSAGSGEATLIFADEQTKGRGRLGRSSYSPSSTGVYMTLILPREAAAGSAMLTTICAGVAVCGAISKLTGKEPKIKWVNDVFLDGKKVCGILAEMIESRIIVGVGINLTTDDFPDDIISVAGSIKTDVSRSRLTAEVANRLLGMVTGFDREAVMREYRELSLVLGKRISYIRSGTKKDGVVSGIDDEGRLVVQTAEGIDLIGSGEISLGSESFAE